MRGRLPSFHWFWRERAKCLSKILTVEWALSVLTWWHWWRWSMALGFFGWIGDFFWWDLRYGYIYMTWRRLSLSLPHSFCRSMWHTRVTFFGISFPIWGASHVDARLPAAPTHACATPEIELSSLVHANIHATYKSFRWWLRVVVLWLHLSSAVGTFPNFRCSPPPPRRGRDMWGE